MTSSVFGGAILRAASALATEGCKRFSSNLRRISKVKKALASGSRGPADPVIQTALADVIRAIGQQGQYDERAAAFLDAITASGLLDSMCLTAVTGAAPTGTFAAFKHQYDNYFPSSGISGLSPETFFDRLQAMLRVSILGNEKSSVYFAKEALAALRAEAAEGDAHIKARFVLRTASGEELSFAETLKQQPWLKIEPDELNSVVDRLRSAIIPLFDKIRVEGPSMRSVEITAEKIYVEAGITPINWLNESNDVAQSQITVADFLGTLRKSAVVGDPGGGKSTLVRMICNRYLKRRSGAFPVFVTLRKYYAAKKVQSSLSLFEYVLRELSEQSNIFSVEQLRAPVQHLLTYGRCLVVFDGLDEILSVGQRRDVASAITQFCSAYNLCRYIVTSRRVDYHQVSVSGFSVFELSPFSDGDVRKYVRLSALNVFGRREAEVGSDVEKFIEAVNRSAAEFMSNPLLLSLIVWLFNSTQRIPDNRAEVYEECSRLLFERWDSLREISSDVPDAHRLFSLLSFVASEMYLRAELQGGATREWLRRVIKDYFVSDYTDNAEARASHAADKFLEHLAGRAWVLRAVGSDQYEFTHRTFMEFFFAKHLNDKNLSLDKLVDELAPRVISAEWNVPSHLAIQIAVGGKRNYAEHVVRRLIQLYRAANNTAKPVVAEFIGRATEYLQPSESGLEDISKIITLEIREDAEWKAAFISALQTPNEMRGAIFRGLGKGFGALVAQNNMHRISFVLDWLKACTVSQQRTFQMQVPPRLSAFVASKDVFAKELMQELEKLEDVSAAAAKAKFDLTGEVPESVAAKFGLRLWLSSSEGPLNRYDWRGIDFVLMIAEFAKIMTGEQSLESSPYARLAVAVAKSDVSSAVAITKRSIVVQGAKIDSTALLKNADVLDSDLAAGLAFCVMGSKEVPSRWYLADLEAASILNSCSARIAPNAPIFDVVKKWQGGKGQLFQSLQGHHSTVSVQDILK